jgi:two-component system cell cycle sensor histidine kinase/response regulator CckA
MHSVGTLAGGVAHEFNNLLAGIQGYAALGLREPGVSDQVKEFLQYIVALSDRAANLTRQLLAFARKPALSRQPTAMAQLMAQTAELVRRSMCIDVDLELQEAPGSLPLMALTDANQLQQVLINLALNARDALTRPVPIQFRMRPCNLCETLPAFPESVPAGDYVVLEVQDIGKGMPSEILTQALDPFFTTKEAGQGTGLGLPVAFGIIQGHQGYLTIDSRPHEGTTVSLFLTRLVNATLPAGSSNQLAERNSASEQTPSKRILVVDDEQAVLDVVRRFLEIVGHRVTCTTSGAEALQMLEAGTAFDLVILDLMVPREDGASTFRSIRQRWPQLAILLCTGLLQTEAATPQFQGERVELLRKPFRMNELWSAVSRALR